MSFCQIHIVQFIYILAFNLVTVGFSVITKSIIMHIWLSLPEYHLQEYITNFNTASRNLYFATIISIDDIFVYLLKITFHSVANDPNGTLIVYFYRQQKT